MDVSRFEVQRLDHLGLVSCFCKEIGLEELINQRMPKTSHNGMITNGTPLTAECGIELKNLKYSACSFSSTH